MYRRLSRHMRITRRIRLRLSREEKQEREARQEGEKIDMTINIEYEAEEKLDLIMRR